MNLRIIVAVCLFVMLATLVALDLHARRVTSLADRDRRESEDRLAALAHEETELARKIQAAEVRLEETGNLAPPKVAPNLPDTAQNGNAGGRKPQASVVADRDELRALRVRAFVGEQRLKFLAVLGLLKMTPEQLARFDQIQAEYQEAVLDLASAAEAHGVKHRSDLAGMRRDLAATRDAQLREVFGEGYSAWQAASESQGAREMAEELLRQTFQSADGIEPAEVRALANMIKRHARPERGGSYDWSGIAVDAPTVLHGARLKAFQRAVDVRILNEKMSAVASSHR